MEPSDINVETRVVEACARLDVVESRMSVLEESVNRAVETLMPKVDALLTGRSAEEGDPCDTSTTNPVITSASLIEMAKRGDYEALLGFLEDIEIDIQRNPQHADNGDTALHVAASEGHAKAVMVLLGAGAKVNASGHRLRTPLHCAVAQGHLAVAQRLLMAGAKVDAMDADGATPLGLAAGQGKRELVNLILQKGARPNEKAVTMAAENGQWSLVELFLQNERGFVDVSNKEGDPLIMLAAKANRWEMVQLLLEKGASATKCKDAKECVLVWASHTGQADAVRDLLRHGAASNDQQLRVALSRAKSAAVVWAFVDVVPDKVRGASGEFGFIDAAIHGHSDVLVAFLEAGVDINAKEGRNRVALFFAAANGRLACVRELLQRGADVNADNVDGNTPLHVAASGGHVDCVRALVEAGASTAKRNKEGKTPFEVARSEDVRVVLSGEL